MVGGVCLYLNNVKPGVLFLFVHSSPASISSFAVVAVVALLAVADDDNLQTNTSIPRHA